MAEKEQPSEVSRNLDMGLEINLKMRGQNLKSIVRGWKSGSYMLLDLPVLDGDFMKVIPDMAVSFRFVNNGSVISCSTTIMSFLKQPANLMVLDFPKRYEKYPLRKNVRMNTELPGIYYRLTSVSPEEKQIKNKATVFNIGTTGALFSSKIDLKLSSSVALSVKLSHLEKVTNIVSIVKNSTKDKMVNEVPYFMTGVEFQKIDEESKIKITNFVESNQDFT